MVRIDNTGPPMEPIDFNNMLDKQLGSMEISNEARSKLDLIKEIAKELDKAKEHVVGLEMELRHAMEEYNAELAKALRKRLPQVGVNLSDGRCSASYRSTNLSCRPDLPTQSWIFDPNPHGRRFVRKNGTVLGLANSIDALADAIVNYFGRYKSLR